MSLIDTDYFVKDIAIPKDSESNLTNDIAKYEPEVLTKAFGYELKKLIDTDPASPARIKDLVEGKEYTVPFNGRDQIIKWNGLINDENISLIAYWVYYWWQRNNATHTTSLGEGKSKLENSFIVMSNQKIGNAWYRLRELYGYPGQHILEPSAYNFLKENESDYPEWVFTSIGLVTMFGT